MLCHPRAWIRGLFIGCAVALLVSCGGGDQSPMAERNDIAVTGTEAGASPHIQHVLLRASEPGDLAAVAFWVQPKAGTRSRPVAARYTLRYLQEGRATGAPPNDIRLPVFGLYAGTQNMVDILVEFKDGSVRQMTQAVDTPARTGTLVYDQPNILVARRAADNLGFDFFYVKAGQGAPVVIDTDGNVRWVGVSGGNSFSSIFRDGEFYVGDQGSLSFKRLSLDGQVVEATVNPAGAYEKFHHNVDPGKLGFLAEFDGRQVGMAIIESMIAEIDKTGKVLKSWDLADIVANHMRAGGDDPGQFVRLGIDWFHMNAALYDPRDDSLVLSSRENFVIKVDYQSGNIRWILGDPTKYWYTFPSLRAKALRLEAGGRYPIGQHAISINSAGELLLFNNGAPSSWQPVGAPIGETRAYSTVSAYAVDPVAMTAREVWSFDYGRSVLSEYCSSVYESRGQSMLVSYALAGGRTKARLVGLTAAREVAFDIEYPTTGCNTAWNAVPIDFDRLRFD